MRVATIDIGTNTVLMLVAEKRPDGAMVAVAERATITRLGAGVDRERRFSTEAVARTRACLEGYARLASELEVERTAVVGTSAMRDSGGGGELALIVSTLFGVELRVISGAEEARLTFTGALAGLEVPRHADVAVFDIGGGSTEVVVGRWEGAKPTISYIESFDLGSVRLTERFKASDPPTLAEINELKEHVRAAFGAVPSFQGREMPIGVAGTMTTLAAVAFGISPYVGASVHGRVLSRDSLGEIVQRLASLDLHARRRLPGMEPQRADVIVAGGQIALALLEHWQSPAVRVSDRGLRWGLARELAS